jgi:hypothetical protein
MVTCVVASVTFFCSAPRRINPSNALSFQNIGLEPRFTSRPFNRSRDAAPWWRHS